MVNKILSTEIINDHRYISSKYKIISIEYLTQRRSRVNTLENWFLYSNKYKRISWFKFISRNGKKQTILQSRKKKMQWPSNAFVFVNLILRPTQRVHRNENKIGILKFYHKQKLTLLYHKNWLMCIVFSKLSFFGCIYNNLNVLVSILNVCAYWLHAKEEIFCKVVAELYRLACKKWI